NAAAVAALLQEYAVDLTPAKLEAVLETTARDVEGAPASSGADLVTGSGLIDAQAALDEFPAADAGPDQTVATGSNMTLDGTGSTDNKAITAFSWSQVSGPPMTLNNADTAQAGFTAPTTTSTLAFELKVTDADGLSTVDTIQVSVDDSSSSSSSGGGGGGCTMGSGNGPLDPMLLLLVALSGLIMFRKKAQSQT
ncbi:MAG: JDVT-CTERM domain-containing protein, partial [Nitrococcus sp.]|nr:JDVT-CTERM domain-containing protein [Nitrococcus sp.]